MPSAAPAGQSPAIRPFQMDSISLGQLANSVNLFRGDVTLTQSLFTLPGRTDDQGLDVTVALSYQSNVVRAAQTWNRDQPTGVAGLGFGMGLACIELDDEWHRLLLSDSPNRRLLTLIETLRQTPRR